MTTVKIAELKNRLSYYLNRVRQGESILVAGRRVAHRRARGGDHVIARIERVGSHGSERGTDSEWLKRLEKDGVIRRGKGKLSAK